MIKKHKEPKSRNTMLAFRPSVYEAFQKIAYMQRTSPNSLVGNWMEDYVKEHQNLVHQYDEENPEN